MGLRDEYTLEPVAEEDRVAYDLADRPHAAPLDALHLPEFAYAGPGTQRGRSRLEQDLARFRQIVEGQ